MGDCERCGECVGKKGECLTDIITQCRRGPYRGEGLDDGRLEDFLGGRFRLFVTEAYPLGAIMLMVRWCVLRVVLVACCTFWRRLIRR